METQEINYDLDDIKEVFLNEAKQNKVKIISVKDFFLNRVKELEETKKLGMQNLPKTHIGRYLNLLKKI